jgi:hypothetical protein
LKNDGVVFVNQHKENLEKIVRLDRRHVERKIICLMNSDLSDRISKKRIRIKAGKATS